jgi:hypothetical protein
MKHFMSLKARYELTAVTAPRYQRGSKKEKQKVLDEFVLVTGYHRKYAVTVLRHWQDEKLSKPKTKRRRSRKYDEQVQDALIVIWKAAHCICSKRLVPCIEIYIDALERFGHLQLTDTVREKLLTISASTIDRILNNTRLRGRAKGIGTTKPGELLKKNIPIRTFADWDDKRPGFTEADLVAHCGSFVAGSFLHTLTMTDVSTGWTECTGLLVKDQQVTLKGIEKLREQFPFDLLGLDTDNGKEFINYLLWQYCSDENITFTRSRPYRKNDQCHVEQKNGSVVRRFIGYDRYEGVAPCRILNALYSQLRLYVNFFQPSFKLMEKKRNGSKVSKKYDTAQTPYQRVLAAPEVCELVKTELRQQFESLDPVDLLARVENLQDALWRYANQAQPLEEAKLPIVGQPRRTRKPPKAPPAPISPVAYDDRVKRRYRRQKPEPIVRYWRTRKDPFADVWKEVEQRLGAEPYLTGKFLFGWLCEKYPSKFTSGQMRTLQRRVREWRLSSVEKLIEDDFFDH